MTKTSWTIDELKFQLNTHPLIKGWVITEENIHRRERYFLTEGNRVATDQDRNIRARDISAILFVRLSKLGRQGEISKKFFTTLQLKEQIESAIEAALQTDHQNWELPLKGSENIPQVFTTDPDMAEDIEKVTENLTSRIIAAIQKPRASVFNSAELFLSIHNRELHLSNGLTHRSSQSRIYTEAAFSFEKTLPNGKTISDEYLNSHWAVHMNQLPIEEIFDQAIHRAEHSLEVTKPDTGQYAVIIDAEVISTLLNGYISQLWASNAYHGLPFIKPNHQLIPEAHGDLLTIMLDPSLPFGADTTAVSNQGLLQLPLKLVEQNQVVETATDKQFGDYLGNPPNTVRGNLVVQPGKLSHQELTQSAEKVIEILQFSGLFSDPNTGTFSSEIRLAKLYDNLSGKVTYLKGGSLSGSIRENFRGLKLSHSVTQRSHFSTEQFQGQGYFGPEFALISNVSIVG
jgi:predicted Zn-dependent protease